MKDIIELINNPKYWNVRITSKNGGTRFDLLYCPYIEISMNQFEDQKRIFSFSFIVLT